MCDLQAAPGWVLMAQAPGLHGQEVFKLPHSPNILYPGPSLESFRHPHNRPKGYMVGWELKPALLNAPLH